MLNHSMTLNEMNKLLMDTMDGISKVQSFPYRKYLSENQELVDALSKECLVPGNTIKLFAPCASGKTHLILSTLAQSLEGKRQIVLLTPNRIQSEQNSTIGFKNKKGIDMKTETVVGGIGKFEFKCEKGISAVYDSIGRIIYGSDRIFAGEEELSRTVLVIDEVHQLYSAKGYRAKCITVVEFAIKRILAAGGSVVYITGTPRKIEGRKANSVFYGIHVGKNGSPLPDIDTGMIELCRKNSHATNMEDYLFHIIKKEVMKGKIPFVRINNKKTIRSLSAKLNQAGIRCGTLTADDKGYYFKGGSKHYDSELYSSILKEAVLPESDCYLTTSVIEVGTSIRYIRSSDGNLRQPAGLLPMFVVRNPKECDFDDMRQFFARARFHIERCMIVMNYCQDKFADTRTIPDLQETLERTYKEAKMSADAYQTAGPDRDRVQPLGQQDETNGIILEPYGYQPGYANIYAVAWQKYFQTLYYCPQYAKEMLSKEFGIPCTITDHTQADIGEPPAAADLTISEELMIKLDVLGYNEGFIEALCFPNNIQDIDETREIRDMKDGMLMMHMIRELLPGNAFSYSEAVNHARRKCESAKTPTVPSKYFPGRNVSVKEEVIHGIFDAMKDWKCFYAIEKQMDFLRWAYGRKSQPDFADYFSGMDMGKGEKTFCLNTLGNTEYLAVFIDMLEAANYSMSWKAICDFAAHSSLNACRNFVKIHTFMKWNRMDVGSSEYMRNVGYLSLVSGAEYHILRNPDRFFFQDVEVDMIDNETGKPFSIMRRESLFPNGFINKTIHMSDCQQIATMMNHEVSMVFKGKYRSRTYTARQIMEMILLIYRFKASHGSMVDANGEKKVVITGLRKYKTDIPKETITEESLGEEIDQYLPPEFRNNSDLSGMPYFSNIIYRRLQSLLDESTALKITAEISIAVTEGTYRAGDAAFLIKSCHFTEGNLPVPISLKDQIVRDPASCNGNLKLLEAVMESRSAAKSPEFLQKATEYIAQYCWDEGIPLLPIACRLKQPA